MEVITSVVAIIALVVVIIVTSRERLQIIKIMKAKNIDEVLAVAPNKDEKEVVTLDDGRFVSLENMPLKLEKEEE